MPPAGRERPPDDPLLLSGRRFVGPNQWPADSDLPGFRANLLEYAAAMDSFARRFVRIVAAALDLPPAFFDDAFTDSMHTLRLSHYPPVAPEPNQFGIAPHTDSNFMTFLAQTEIPGLQLRLPPNGPNGGGWLDVPYVPNSFAVNSGDTMPLRRGSRRARGAPCVARLSACNITPSCAQSPISLSRLRNRRGTSSSVSMRASMRCRICASGPRLSRAHSSTSGRARLQMLTVGSSRRPTPSISTIVFCSSNSCGCVSMSNCSVT